MPGQCLLEVNEPTSDDNDEDHGDNTVVVYETCCSETEGMLAKKKCSRGILHNADTPIVAFSPPITILHYATTKVIKV